MHWRTQDLFAVLPQYFNIVVLICCCLLTDLRYNDGDAFRTEKVAGKWWTLAQFVCGFWKMSFPWFIVVTFGFEQVWERTGNWYNFNEDTFSHDH